MSEMIMPNPIRPVVLFVSMALFNACGSPRTHESQGRLLSRLSAVESHLKALKGRVNAITRHDRELNRYVIMAARAELTFTEFKRWKEASEIDGLIDTCMNLMRSKDFAEGYPRTAPNIIFYLGGYRVMISWIENSLFKENVHSRGMMRARELLWFEIMRSRMSREMKKAGKEDAFPCTLAAWSLTGLIEKDIYQQMLPPLIDVTFMLDPDSGDGPVLPAKSTLSGANRCLDLYDTSLKRMLDVVRVNTERERGNSLETFVRVFRGLAAGMRESAVRSGSEVEALRRLFWGEQKMLFRFRNRLRANTSSRLPINR